MKEKVRKDWLETETPSPTHRQKSLLISSPFSRSLAAPSGMLSIMGAWEGAGKEGCRLGNEQKPAAHDYFGPRLINSLCKSQTKRMRSLTLSLAGKVHSEFQQLWYPLRQGFAYSSCNSLSLLPWYILEGVLRPLLTFKATFRRSSGDGTHTPCPGLFGYRDFGGLLTQGQSGLHLGRLLGFFPCVWPVII